MISERVTEITKLLRNAERLEKYKNSHVNRLITYMITGIEHQKKKDKDKDKVFQRNEMQIYTVLHLVLLVKMKNIIPNKIYLTVSI